MKSMRWSIAALGFLAILCCAVATPLVAAAGGDASSERDASSEVEAFNAWARTSGHQGNLLRWVVLGLNLSKDVNSSVEVTYDGVEFPRAARVEVVQSGFMDDSVKGRKHTLRFLRQPCPDCDGGWSPWLLESMELSHSCYRGREGFSSEPCP